MAQPQLKLGKMENAPDWYGKSLDELDFEWSREEELELERYCEKILENAEAEEMTPMQRFEATMQGKDKDRLHVLAGYLVTYAVRTLDSFTDAIKPGDAYKWPKLHVKAHLAMAARFKLDIIDVYTIAYAENFWGADARMVDYNTPQMLGEPPIKTMEDIESVAVPDAKKHGLFPGYLWAVREIKRILAKHGADKVMPVTVSFCPDPLGGVCEGMMGFAGGIAAAKKNPALLRACIDKAADWAINFGSAVVELNPDQAYMCSFLGVYPPKMGPIDNEYYMDVLTRVGKAVSPGEGKKPYLQHACGVEGWIQWMRLYYPHGAVGPGTFGGWKHSPAAPIDEVFGYSREMDLNCGITIDDKILLSGDMDAIEAELAARVKLAKLHPKHFAMIGAIDYWTPQPVVEKTMELAKRLGRF